MEVNEDRLNLFMGKMLGDVGAAMNASLMLLGDKLGLYKALAQNGPMDPAALAKTTGTTERYIREWLSAQAASGYVEYDSTSGKFSMLPEQVMALADEDSPVFLGAVGSLVSAIFLDEPKISEAFRTGKGVGLNKRSECLFCGTARFFRTSYKHYLIQQWLPALDGVVDRLTRGAKVADVGCGHGVSTRLMAAAFPNSTFYGFDYHDGSIQKARDLTTNAGLSDRTRVTQSIVPYLLNNSDNAFFSSLAIILVPADGSPLEEGKHYRFKPINGNPNVGVLELEDDVMMFVADGQHRREAIKQALRENTSIGLQHVPVVFIPFKKNSQVRQLFSDLNLNAKPVSKTLGLAYETRDPVVVATKRVATEVALFRGAHGSSRVNMESNSLSTRSQYVISMNTLKNADAEVLAALHGTTVKEVTTIPALAAVKGLKPEDPKVGVVSAPLIDFWEFVIEHLPPWQEVLDGLKKPGEIREGELADPDTADSEEASSVKDPWGGYVFAYGIGWQAIALAAAALIKVDTANWKQMLADSLDAVNWRKGSHWNGIAMVGTRVNNTGPGIRATAGYILEVGGVRDFLKNLPSVPTGIELANSLFETLDKSRAGTGVDQAMAAE